MDVLQDLPKYQKRAVALQKRLADILARATRLRQKSEALAQRAERDAAKKKPASPAAAGGGGGGKQKPAAAAAATTTATTSSS